jgi:hypothetical protein
MVTKTLKLMTLTVQWQPKAFSANQAFTIHNIRLRRARQSMTIPGLNSLSAAP